MNDNERVVFEGIFFTSSLATSEVILSHTEEYVYPTENSGEWDAPEPRLMEMYIDRYVHLLLENVAWVEFLPNDETHHRQCINITRNGFIKVQKPKQEITHFPTPSEFTIPTEASSARKSSFFSDKDESLTSAHQPASTVKQAPLTDKSDEESIWSKITIGAT